MPELTSVAQLMDELEARRVPGEIRWFRGHTDTSWTLKPSVARERAWLENELLMLKRFRQDAAPRLRERPGDEWEWLFLAQHYQVPTRLLDWSENPLVGLYFAVESDDDADGELWTLDPAALNRIGGVSRGELLMFGQDDVLETYHPTRVSSGGRDYTPLAAIATRTFDRIVAQTGTFTIVHREYRALEEYNGCTESWRVPLEYKEQIRQQLLALNVGAHTIYPDLEHLGQYVKGLY